MVQAHGISDSDSRRSLFNPNRQALGGFLGNSLVKIVVKGCIGHSRLFEKGFVCNTKASPRLMSISDEESLKEKVRGTLLHCERSIFVRHEYC